MTPRKSPIAIIGQTGQLARALTVEAMITEQPLFIMGRTQLDLQGQPDTLARQLGALPQVSAIINAAAYTQVDRAESEPDLAHQINAIAPAQIVKFCQGRDIPLIHISTDYVFSGDSQRPYRETDSPAPINAYGRSKHAGELPIAAAADRFAILRTSWLYDGFGQNFFRTMLSMAAQGRSEISVVNDQIGRPIHTRDLAKACLTTANRLSETHKREIHMRSGIYHVTSGGDPVSWAGFAKAIFAQAPAAFQPRPKIRSIPTSDYPTPAKRPSYSVLDSSKFQTATGFQTEDWRQGIDLAWAEYLKSTQ